MFSFFDFDFFSQKNKTKERRPDLNITNDTSKIDSQNILFSENLDETPASSQEVFTQNVFRKDIPIDEDILVSTQDQMDEKNEDDIIENYNAIQQKIVS